MKERKLTQAELIRSVDEAFNRWFPVRYGKKYRHPWKARRERSNAARAATPPPTRPPAQS